MRLLALAATVFTLQQMQAHQCNDWCVWGERKQVGIILKSGKTKKCYCANVAEKRDAVRINPVFDSGAEFPDTPHEQYIPKDTRDSY